jgi:hypothetical protein
VEEQAGDYYLGDSIELKCQGKAPYVIGYENFGRHKKIRVEDPSETTQFKFPHFGRFYFTQVRDGNGCVVDVTRNDCDNHKDVYVDVLQKPKIVWKPLAEHVCDKEQIQFRFVASGGKPPFKVSLQYGDTSSVFNLEEEVSIVGVDYQGNDPVVNFTVTLVEDSNLVEGQVLEENEYQVTIHEIPAAHFVTPENSCFMGKAFKNNSVHLRFDGTAPFDFEVNSVAYRTNESVFSINISEAGQFVVQKVRDRFCSNAEALERLNIRPMPTVRVTGGEVLCDGEETEVTFEFFGGQQPYRLVYSDGESVQAQTVNSDRLIIKTSKSGMYWVQSLADDYCALERTR